MVDTFSYVPTKEDIFFVNMIKSHCEKRKLDFAPGINHNQFNEVLEWCVKFQEKRVREMCLSKPFQEICDRLNNNSPTEEDGYSPSSVDRRKK